MIGSWPQPRRGPGVRVGVRRACIALVLALIVLPSAAAEARPLVTGVTDPAGPGFDEPDPVADNALVHAAGAHTSRMIVIWKAMAPTRPADPANPGDPAYRLASLDARIQHARDAGLEPIICIAVAPDWALEPGHTLSPRVDEVRAFATALARRYSGRAGAPRVRYWQIWNEPNLVFAIDQPDGVAHYRAMVNAWAGAVKGVRRSNQVIAGGLGPFGGDGPPGSTAGNYGTRPLPFMRRLLCVRSPRARRRTCTAKLRFDIWAHHPYTSGGPTHRATHRGDVSLGDLGAMRRLLDRARRLGAIRAPSPPAFWATEFSWDTNPPDGGGLPLELHARWVSEALYRMWKAGVSQVTWFQLRDKPMSQTQTGIWQSGLYFVDGFPKPALQSFRFPFVAYRSGRRVTVWGRTPLSDARRVRIEQLAGTTWRPLRTIRSDRDGIFRARPRRRGRGPVRARVVRAPDVSLAFSLQRPRDLPVVPFGTGAAPE